MLYLHQNHLDIHQIIHSINFEQILLNTGLIENEFLRKLMAENIADSSRIKAIEHNLKSFMSDPIFGVGISNAQRNMRHVADTSTSTYLLSIFGLLGGLYTVCWIYGILKNVKKNLFVKILLLTIALIIVNKEPHHQILSSWCILFYLIKGDLISARIEGTERDRQRTKNNWGELRL